MFSIYDILREADGDENAPANNADTPEAGNQQQQNNQQQANNNNQNQQNANSAGNDDFDMDMSLDDTDTGDENTDADDTGDDFDTGDTGDDMGDEPEPVEANTDMFASLSAEEQVMKISELKRQYAELFNSCDTLIEKLSNIQNSESTVAPLSKITNTLTDLKRYITDYLYEQFDNNSFYENDVRFNIFLSIFFSVSEVLKDIYKINIQNE